MIYSTIITDITNITTNGLQSGGPVPTIISKSYLLDQGTKIRRSLPSLMNDKNDNNNNNNNNNVNSKNIKVMTMLEEQYASSKQLFYPTYYDTKNRKKNFLNNFNNNNNNNNSNSNNNNKRGFSNWLLKNKIIIGQYPGPTPEHNGPTISSSQAHIDSLINNNNNSNNNNDDSNVCLFCCLQSEIPKQDDYNAWDNGRVYLPIGGGREEFPNYFGHYAPLVQASYHKNKKNGSSSSSSVDVNGDNNDNEGPPTFFHAPIIDLSTPSSSSSLYSTLSYLLDVLDKKPNCAIYIHCWGGRGRAGLVGSCLLSLIFPDLTSEQILDWVQRGYDTRLGAEAMPFGLKRSPQTPSQREFVRNFVKDMQSVYD